MSHPKNEKEVANSFMRASRAINLVTSKLKDDFLSQLIEGQMGVIFRDLIECFRERTPNNLKTIKSRVNNLSTTVETLCHLGRIKKLDYLVILSALLSFESASMNHWRSPILVELEPRIKDEAVDKSNSDLAPIVRDKILNPIKKDLLNFITIKKEVLNLEIFNHLPNLTRRSIKRHLSELISKGYVYRQSQGKKVFYGAKNGKVHTS